MKQTLSIVLIITSIATFSQPKEILVELKGRSFFESCIDLGDAGIIFQEAWANVVNKHPGAVRHYSPTGELKWKKDVTNIPGETFVTASPDGAIVYHINLKGSISLLQIKPDGSSIEKELPALKEPLKNLTTIFCDGAYLYFLCTQDRNHFSDKKKGTEKLILNRVSNVDFSHKQFILDLPPITADKNASYWSLLGQKNDQKYLIAKEVNPKTGVIKFSIASFNTDGVVQKNYSVTRIMKPEQELLAPTDYTDKSSGAVIYEDMDDQFMSRREIAPGTSATHEQTNGRFATAYFDPFTEQFYMVTVSKPKGSNKITTCNFRISKYGMNGAEPLWESMIEHTMGYTFAMHVLPSGSINLTAYSEVGVVGYEVDAKDGKLLATKKIDYNDKYANILNSNWKWRLIKTNENAKMLRSAQYISNLPAEELKSGVFGNFVNSKGELAVVISKKGDTRLVYFAN